MVGSAAHAAAVEERQKKLQEYLAAKGKLKYSNTKPYLKDQKQCSKPPTSRSTTRLKNDGTKWTHPHAARRPTGNVLQPKSPNVSATQRPKTAAPKILGKEPHTGWLSSKPDDKLSGNTQVQYLQKTASSTVRKLARKSSTLRETQCTATNNRTARWMGPVKELHAENQLSVGFPEERNKENWPLSAPADHKPQPEIRFCNAVQSKGNLDNPSKSSLVPKHTVHRGTNSGLLPKDRVTRPFVHETQVRVPTGKSQQPLPKGAGTGRPRDKNPKTVPSHLVQSLATTRESKKLITKKEDIKIKKAENGPNEVKVRSHTVIKRAVEAPLTRTNRVELRGGKVSTGASSQQALKRLQASPKRRPHVTALPWRTATTQPYSTGGTSEVRAPRPMMNQYHYSLQKEPRTLDPTACRTVPRGRSGNPKGQPCVSRTRPPMNEGEGQQSTLLEAPGPRGKPNTERKRGEEDRRKKLEEWLASKGKTYKRPPMKFLAQNKNVQKLNLSFWKSIEEEEEIKRAETELANKINGTLAGCLKLIEQGWRSPELLAILSGVPEAEKFAKFWICKAKLLASQNSSEVIGLYEAAVRSGATPIQELRDVVLNILKNAKKTTIEGISSETNSTSVKETAKKETPQEFNFLTPRENVQIRSTPQIAKKYEDDHLMSCIKLQITPLPRTPGMPKEPDVKLVTPVRRSLRIECARPNYPETLREHGTVVASLGQLTEVDETDCYIYRQNEALLGDTELQMFAS